MPQRNRTAVHIHLLAIEAQFFFNRQILRRERFIHFNQIDVVQRKPRLLQCNLRRRHRTAAHYLRLNSSDAPTHNPPQRFNASLARFFQRHQHHRRSAIDNAARVSGSHGAIFPDRSLQLGQPLHPPLPSPPTISPSHPPPRPPLPIPPPPPNH